MTTTRGPRRFVEFLMTLKVVSWLMRAASAAFLGLAFWLGLRESALGMAVAAAVAGTLGLLSIPSYVTGLMNRISVLKIAGMEAHLTQKVEEADALISRLNRVLNALAMPTYTMMARFGRWGTGIPPEARRQMISELDASLSLAGVPANQIKIAKDDIFRFDMLDIVFKAIEKMDPLLVEFAENVRKQANNVPGPMTIEKGEELARISKAASDIDELRSKLSSRLLAEHYSSFPKRIAPEIEKVSALRPDQKTQLLAMIQPEIMEMRAYLANIGA